MSYKHGVFGYQIPTQDTLPPDGVATLPVYVGTAPVQQLSSYTGAVNVPLLITSFDDAKAKIGYSDDWDTYTLCEAVYAHFKNSIAPMGPIVVINVLDPATHKTAAAPASVVITNGIGYINDEAIISTIAITGKVQGTDYKAEYAGDGSVKITQITTLVSPVTVNYDAIDKSKVTDADVIGELNSDGNRTGIYCIELINQNFNMIPTILAAPGFGHIPAIKTELVSKAKKVNGHWDLQVVADIESSTTKTIAAAKTWKDTNAYTDFNLKVCWPKVKKVNKVFWLSTMTVLRMQQTDFNNDNVPYESPSNKPIDITGAILGDGSAIRFDEVQANELTAKGITTINFRGGLWVLWGPHNANYEYGKDIDISQVFDAGTRMMMYLTNTFQDKYMPDVDGPLNRSKVDTILNDSQTWLNSLIADGKMLYAKIAFNETSNSINSIVEGDFVFDIQTTTTPVAKSLTFVVQYTTAGITTLFGGGN